MKKFFIGLVIGIAITAAAGYFMLPDIKQKAYDSGYGEGNKKGIVTGTAAGITQGIAQIQAQQKHERDSIAMVQRNLEAQRRVARKHKEAEIKPVQNWHVIEGKIQDPVSDK